MYNDHQSCSLLFVDAETMEWVSYPYEASENHPYEASEENKAKYKNVYTYYNSHSFGQRIVATTDGGYIMADHADASRRGILITKIYLDEENNFNSLRARMIHFREGAMGSHGYNYTYALMGNVIELSDGYMYIGAMEKTLDRAYGASVNESWNICIQKYKKDFQNYETIEEMQMFDTEVRTTTGTPPELPEGSTALDNPYGRLYLTGDEKDYGIKWLTDLKNEKMVIQLRAVELENDQIAILYELVNMAEDTRTGKYDLYDYDGDIYYMIIDGNGNIVSQPTIIPNVDLSPEEILPYKDGKIYWTTTLGEKTIEVNVLDVKNPLPTSKGDINKDGKVNISDARYGLAGIVKNTLTEEEIQLGDVDGNSKCNISDIRKILMLIVGKIDSLD